MSHLFLLLLSAAVSMPAAQVLIRTTTGETMEGEASLAGLRIQTPGGPVTLKPASVLSIHNAAEASPEESARIEAGFAAISGADRKARDGAVEDLTSIGLPVLTPLLKTLKDTDQHEPRPLYRLFERIIPSYADDFDRTLSMVRLPNGEALRGKLPEGSLEIRTSGGKQSIPWSKIRTLAVRQPIVRRAMEVHSLKHCQQIEYLDTGVVLTASSKVDSSARGFARLSWNADVWACDPDGLKKPAGGNYTSNLFDGQPFGALIGRVGASGEVFFVGRKASKTGLPSGHLMLAVNDNRHWQNNLGTYYVTMTVTDAYDLTSAQ
ncbi:MAG: hypothetical protein JNL98_10040 [Bryobacterales bacterium]|nr:hypothetical protein [Bryobacterales bacterium]